MVDPKRGTETFRSLEQRARDLQRLDGAHPHLRDAITRILDAMEILRCPMFVVEAVRSDARQAELYAQGRRDPGPIVTRADGVRHKSMHQIQTTGFGHAVDCAFLDDPSTTKIEIWDAGQPWQLYGEMGELYGLTWGGRWHAPYDRPHLELSLSSPAVRG